MMTGRPEEAIATADRSLNLAGTQPQVRPIVEALINKGTALMNVGRRTEAAALLRGAAAEADRSGLSHGALRARNNLLGISAADSVADAYGLEREGYELANRLGTMAFVQQFLMILASTSIRVGEWGVWNKQMAALEEAEPIHPFTQMGFAHYRAAVAALRGDGEEARRQLEIAKAAGAQLDSKLGTATLALGQAQVALFLGDWQSAARLALEGATDSNYELDGPDLAAQAAVAGGLDAELAKAITLLQPVRGTGRIAEAALAAAEGGQAARSGRWDEARASYRRALLLRHQAGDVMTAAFDGLTWGLLAGDQDPEAKTALTEAEAFFAWRGSSPMVAACKATFVPVSKVSAAAPPASVQRSEVPAART
jgi:tetratricopeptide (TPR) repeat protein